jgi:hypothetical protein
VAHSGVSVIPSATSKPLDRPALVHDVDYLARELITRLERLQDVEPDGHRRSDWQQAAALARRIRGVARQTIELDRRKARLARRA